MRIRSMMINCIQEDYDKLQIAADLYERKQVRPRGRGSIKDFILEAALEAADRLIAERDKAQGRVK